MKRKLVSIGAIVPNYFHRFVSRFCKRYPNTYQATEIKTWPLLEEYEPDRWRPARSCECVSGGLRRRIKIAWKVFIGEWDAVNWGNNSGEWKNDQVNYRDCTHPKWKETSITG